MRTYPLFIAIFSFLSMMAQAETLYLPHFTFNELWQTTVSISNPNAKHTVVNITAYSQDGNQLGQSPFDIPALGTLQRDMQTLFPEMEPQNGWLLIESQDDVVISGSVQFTAIQQSGTSTLPLNNAEGTRLSMPAVAFNANFQGGFAMVNTSAETADVFVDVYANDGRRLTTHQTQIAPKAKLVSMLTGIVDAEELADVNLVMVSSTHNLTGFALNFASGTTQIVAVPATVVPGEAVQQIPSYQSLEGTWRRIGYDEYVSVQDQVLRLYDSPNGVCGEVDSIVYLDELPPGAIDVVILPDGRTRWTISSGQSLFFERTDGFFPYENCEASNDPFTVFDTMWNMFEKHYAFFAERNVDWDALGDTYRARINGNTTQAELATILGDLIYELDDPHVSLETGDYGDFESQNPRRYDQEIRQRFEAQNEIDDYDTYRLAEVSQTVQNVISYIDDTSYLVEARGNVLAGRINGYPEIGYLGVFQMYGYAEGADFDADADLAILESVMDDVFTHLQGIEKIILDVRINPGGFDVVSQAIAARIVNQKRLAYSKAARDGDHLSAFQSIWLEPYQGEARFEGQHVALLTSELTTSGAEIFTLLMRADARTIQFGEPTAGALSDVLGKQLPNFWQISLSNEVYIDRNGTLWEGPGIQPDVVVPHATLSDLLAEKDSVLEAAIANLNQQ